jgi:TatD DNase family protein
MGGSLPLFLYGNVFSPATGFFRMIDTHCHLDAAEFGTDRRAVSALARAAGVTRIVVPGVGAADFARQKQIVASTPGACAAYGIHPLYLARADSGDLRQLRHYLQHERPVAVGEIGLDFYVVQADRARQGEFFAAQLQLAREFDLPVILHSRRAVDAVLQALRRHRVRGGVAHAFNGSRQQADEFIKLGFKLGFGGALTHPGSRRIRALAAELPLTALVLETDAPDIAPAWLRGGRNSPEELPRIAAELAQLRGISTVELVAHTDANARAVFPLLEQAD